MPRQLSYLLQNKCQPLFERNLRVFHFLSFLFCSHTGDTDLLTEGQPSESSATTLEQLHLVIEGGFSEVTSPGRGCNCIHTLRWSSKRSNGRIGDALFYSLGYSQTKLRGAAAEAILI